MGSGGVFKKECKRRKAEEDDFNSKFLSTEFQGVLSNCAKTSRGNNVMLNPSV